MILVESVDLVGGVAVLDLGQASWPGDESRRAIVAESAAALGLSLLRVRTPQGRITDIRVQPSPAPAPAWPLMAHEAARTPDGVRYRARIAHHREAHRGLASYTELLLRAADVPLADVALVRLVVYELCVNAVEHGKPLRPNGELEIGFETRSDVIRGWVRDACAPFDPATYQPQAVSRLVRERLRRGYGLRIVMRVVDSLQHRHDGEGNRIDFTKELSHETAT